MAIFYGKIHYKWPFSIATLDYQRVQPVCSLWFAGQSFHFSAAVFDCRIVPILDGYQALIMTKHMNNHTMKNAGISIRY